MHGNHELPPVAHLVMLIALKVFMIGSVACFLSALHRIGRGITLTARVKASHELKNEFTPEEREILVRKIKHASLRCL